MIIIITIIILLLTKKSLKSEISVDTFAAPRQASLSINLDFTFFGCGIKGCRNVLFLSL